MDNGKSREGIHERKASSKEPRRETLAGLPYPIWRCRVCGYLSSGENPPEVCPVCKAKKDRFEKFV